MSNVISFEEMGKLWKGAGLSGCVHWYLMAKEVSYFGKKRFGGIIYCQYKMGCKTEGFCFFLHIHCNVPPNWLTHFPKQMGGNSGELKHL